MDLFAVSVPPLTRAVTQARTWLDKVQTFADSKKIEPQVLLTARLAPDQWHCARQLQVVALTPVRLAALVRGQELPGPRDLEPTVEAIRARLDESLAALAEIQPEHFRGVAERVIPLPFMPSKGMVGADFLIQFALPNFYFHYTTAYAILRHQGVEVGKMDYLGPLAMRDV